MKKFYIFLLVILLAGCGQVEKPIKTQIIAGGSEKAQVGVITAPENNAYKIGVKNFQDEYKSNIIDDKALQYKLGDKYISFKPTEMRWDTSKFKDVQSSEKENTKTEYKSIFGSGIDLEVKSGERTWDKIVKINKIDDLGEISNVATNLEIEFIIETNFVIDGWDRESDLEITDKVRIGDYSYLEPAMAWDSYSEEFCEDDNGEEVCETLRNIVELKSYLKKKGDDLVFIKQIPIDWLKAAQFPVYSDADIVYGTAVAFHDTGAIEYETAQVVDIDTDKFVVCWGDPQDGSKGKCRIGTVSGDVITLGDKFEYNANIGIGFGQSVCKMETNKFVVVYQGDGQADDGFATIGIAATGTSIVWGTEKEYHDTDTEYPACATIDTNKVGIFYRDETGGDIGTLAVLTSTSSGTMITAGSPVVFEGSIYLTTATKLATDKYVVCYGDSGDSVKGKCVAVIVSGTTPAEGAEATFETVRMRQSSATQLDTDKFALAWDNQDDDRGKTRIGTVSGDTISFAGASSTFALTDTNSPNAIAIDNDDFVIVYEDETDGEQGKSVYAQVSGTTITPGTPEVFYNRNTSLPKIALISSKKVVVSYINQRLGPNQGQVIIGIIQEVDADDTHQGQMEVKGGTMQIKGNNYQVK